MKPTYEDGPTGRRHHSRDKSHGDRRGGRRRHRGGSGRAGRGELRAAVLQLLAEQPMHGYQLMQAITEKTEGRWAPSPGAIYPTINHLEAEGLVTVEEADGRRLASITDAGRALVTEAQEAGRDPFAEFSGDSPGYDLRRLVFELGDAVRHVARSGTDEQREAAAKTLTEARKSMYLLLAEGSD
jgi:DNA-binding PadR family transcriptional regulator